MEGFPSQVTHVIMVIYMHTNYITKMMRHFLTNCDNLISATCLSVNKILMDSKPLYNDFSPILFTKK